MLLSNNTTGQPLFDPNESSLSEMASLMTLTCSLLPRSVIRGLRNRCLPAEIQMNKSVYILNIRCKSSIRRDLVPRLLEEELEERYTKGSGPGGQNVNKMTNAVFLKHLPTGLWVKCHQQRSLEQNRRIARKLLVTKLDNFVNGEDSIENQEKIQAREKLEKKKEKTKAKYAARAASKAHDSASDSCTEEQEHEAGGDAGLEANSSSPPIDKEECQSVDIKQLHDQQK